MSTKGKSGFLLPKGMVWQDLGVSEGVNNFLQGYAAGAKARDYERDLPSRVAKQTPGRSGFGLPKGTVWQDLGISEWLNPVGSHASRVDDDAYKQNYQQITQDDVNSGMFTTDAGFAEDYTPPIFQQLFNLAASNKNASANNGNFFTNLFGIGQNKTALGEQDWLAATEKSPAAASGAFTDDERWQQQLKHRQWLADNNRL
tara:strand:+ start:189 stop:791 length:603 start_codon:yes stop_codon:yes gene_type:complete